MRVAPETANSWVVMGRITGLFGVQGWLKVFSYTDPRSAITDYEPLYLRKGDQWQAYPVQDSRVQGKGIIIKFLGCDDRNAAAELVGRDIAVRRDQLPALAPDEYYWSDLQGLRVVTTDAVELGRVDHLFATGANDVMVVKGERERLMPFLRGDVVKRIDLEQAVIVVDWDPDF